MSGIQQRRDLLELIEEACTGGARLTRARTQICLSERTVQRWQHPDGCEGEPLKKSSLTQHLHATTTLTTTETAYANLISQNFQFKRISMTATKPPPGTPTDASRVTDSVDLSHRTELCATESDLFRKMMRAPTSMAAEATAGSHSPEPSQTEEGGTGLHQMQRAVQNVQLAAQAKGIELSAISAASSLAMPEIKGWPSVIQPRNLSDRGQPRFSAESNMPVFNSPDARTD